MKDIAPFIIELRQQQVILDRDLACIYGVETRDINKAVKNNPDKFPEGYIFQLSNQELKDLRWKISTANRTQLSKTRMLPQGIHRKGLVYAGIIIHNKHPQK